MTVLSLGILHLLPPTPSARVLGSADTFTGKEARSREANALPGKNEVDSVLVQQGLQREAHALQLLVVRNVCVVPAASSPETLARYFTWSVLQYHAELPTQLVQALGERGGQVLVSHEMCSHTRANAMLLYVVSPACGASHLFGGGFRRARFLVMHEMCRHTRANEMLPPARGCGFC